jgi:hypothetical protein
LINHPLDVPFVIKGESVIARYFVYAGSDRGRYYEDKRALQIKILGF